MANETDWSEEELDNLFNSFCQLSAIYCLPFDEARRDWAIGTEIIFSSLLVFIGVIGNGLSIAVLSKDTKASSTNTILKALAVWDILFLLSTITKNGLRVYIEYYVEDPYYQQHGETIATINSRVIYPLYLTARCASYGVTLLVTIDRYVAVCKPMTIRSPRVVIISIAVVSVTSAIIHIPAVFEYHSSKYGGARRETFLDQSKVLKVYRTVQFNDLWSSTAFLIGYKLIFQMVIRDLMTMYLLILFNYKLYQGLKAARRRYLHMRQESRLKTTRRHISSGESLTRTIVIVVASFTLLNIPSVVGHVLTTSRDISIQIHDKDFDFMVNDNGIYKKYYVPLVHVLSLISTSMNFVIYVIFAKKFKRIFLTVFLNCGCVKRQLESSMMSSSSDDVMASNKRRVKQEPVVIDSNLSLVRNNNSPPKYHNSPL